MEAWQKPETFALWLAIVLTAGILLSSFIILLNRLYMRRVIFEKEKAARLKLNYQKQLLKDSILVQERERERIAANLHDDLISKLNVVSLLLHSGQQHAQADPQAILSQSIDLARGISHDLRPPMLSDWSLEELCKDFLMPLQKEYKLSFQLSGKENRAFQDEEKLQLLRVYQEVINNSLKHAKAEALQVRFRYGSQWFCMIIADNGKGFDPQHQSKGLGLKNIELRLQSLQGNYKFKSAPGKGMRFICTVPY